MRTINKQRLKVALLAMRTVRPAWRKRCYVYSLLNIQGLSTERVNKLKSKELHNIFKNSDIILLTETWTNEFSDLNFTGFQSYVLHRKLKKRNAKRESGGIAIFIREQYALSDTLVFQDEDDILWVRGSCKMFCHWVRITSVLRFIKHILLQTFKVFPCTETHFCNLFTQSQKADK